MVLQSDNQKEQDPENMKAEAIFTILFSLRDLLSIVQCEDGHFRDGGLLSFLLIKN